MWNKLLSNFFQWIFVINDHRTQSWEGVFTKENEMRYYEEHKLYGQLKRSNMHDTTTEKKLMQNIVRL